MKAGMHLLCMSQLIDKQKSNNILFVVAPRFENLLCLDGLVKF